MVSSEFWNFEVSDHWWRNPPTKWAQNASKYRKSTITSPEMAILVWKFQGIHLTKSENEKELYGPSNVITNWASLIDYVKTLPFHLREEEKFIFLSKVEGIPPEIVYSMQITNDFKVNCYNRTEAVPTRRLVGKFTAKLETYSQLNAILEWKTAEA